MNNIKKLVLILTSILCLGGCVSKDNIILGEKTDSWQGHYTVSYTRFTGIKTVEIYIEEPQLARISVITTMGKLDIEILGRDDNDVEHSFYYGEDVPTGSSDIKLEPGIYKIKTYGVKHVGGFTIDYR